MKRCSAFTLVELMVVLVLMGILSAMILPEMKGTFADASLRSAGRDLVNVFKLAYSQAVSHNQVHVVRLEEKTGHFALERRGGSGRSQSEFVPLKDISGGSGKIDGRISVEIHKTGDRPLDNSGPEAELLSTAEPLSQADNVLAFYPDGTADGAEILLKDRAGFGLRLRIDPITARVEVLELKQP